MRGYAIDISNRFRSPRNPERKIRQSTELIVLHTTEAPARSSLNKLSDRGEAHYCVTEYGGIFRIVDRDRVAFHAGRSMWRGKEDVDLFSIGIECVGYHDKPMNDVQLEAIRKLVKELQAMYRLSDDKVVCHSHVAYGMPNKWQKKRHRGRKRCGMLFAMPSVRRKLGLSSKPAVDADTRAKRLVVGDKYLSQVLYGNIDTMVGKKAAAPQQGGVLASIGKWFGADKKKPAPPPKPSSAPSSIDQLKAGGYVLKGSVSKTTPAIKIAGKRWNAADTYYTIRNKVVPGNQIDAAHIEAGMGVWMRK